MAITEEEILVAAKAMFSLSTHYPEDGHEIGIIDTWETYSNIGRNQYLKEAKVALMAVEKLRNCNV